MGNGIYQKAKVGAKRFAFSQAIKLSRMAAPLGRSLVKGLNKVRLMKRTYREGKVVNNLALRYAISEKERQALVAERAQLYKDMETVKRFLDANLEDFEISYYDVMDPFSFNENLMESGRFYSRDTKEEKALLKKYQEVLEELKLRREAPAYVLESLERIVAAVSTKRVRDFLIYLKHPTPYHKSLGKEIKKQSLLIFKILLKHRQELLPYTPFNTLEELVRNYAGLKEQAPMKFGRLVLQEKPTPLKLFLNYLHEQAVRKSWARELLVRFGSLSMSIIFAQKIEESEGGEKIEVLHPELLRLFYNKSDGFRGLFKQFDNRNYVRSNGKLLKYISDWSSSSQNFKGSYCALDYVAKGDRVELRNPDSLPVQYTIQVIDPLSNKGIKWAVESKSKKPKILRRIYHHHQAEMWAELTGLNIPHIPKAEIFTDARGTRILITDYSASETLFEYEEKPRKQGRPPLRSYLSDIAYICFQLAQSLESLQNHGWTVELNRTNIWLSKDKRVAIDLPDSIYPLTEKDKSRAYLVSGTHRCTCGAHTHFADPHFEKGDLDKVVEKCARKIQNIMNHGSQRKKTGDPEIDSLAKKIRTKKYSNFRDLRLDFENLRQLLS